MKIRSIARSGTPKAPATPASRPVRTRPQLRDPRLAIGILLVAAAVALGIYLMKAVDSRVGVWAASSTLTPGTSLAGNVVKVDVHEDVAGNYLSADAEPSGSVTRTVGEGELIARSATSRDDGEHTTRSIVLPLGTELPKSAVRGASVDVWFIPRAVPGKTGGEPLIIAPGAIIEQVHEASTLGVRAHGSIEVSVTAENVPAVLSALAEQGLIAVVPQGGTL
ncbi:hypothetical protein BSZ39_08635 [Bowdeniella nasicola]|uniref:SAF domain-containing protein n=1 Tax=Bowdeniella nasicola TaxID=208480 RepID=A0A1Q5Q1A4_9ACTO|nr:hypothetical protein [Bowdeniella nasicola]OKL53611.1 hypothetical protein BSZ39_08635 [Bowdeniella nasicola]